MGAAIFTDVWTQVPSISKYLQPLSSPALGESPKTGDISNSSHQAVISGIADQRFNGKKLFEEKHDVLSLCKLPSCVKTMERNGGFLKYGYPQIIHFNGIFSYKPSILGIPHLWKPLCMDAQFAGRWVFRPLHGFELLELSTGLRLHVYVLLIVTAGHMQSRLAAVQLLGQTSPDLVGYLTAVQRNVSQL